VDAPAPQPTGTIDITDTVEAMRQTWVSWAVAFLFAEEVAIPGMEWVALPIVADIDKEMLKLILDAISKQGVMLAFFTNTAIRKASQAADYVAMVGAKKALGPNVSDEVYKDAEKKELLAFRNFVAVSN
jgi:hypothetical protein